MDGMQGLPQEDWFPLSGKQGKDKEGVIQLRLQFEVRLLGRAPVLHPHGRVGSGRQHLLFLLCTARQVPAPLPRWLPLTSSLGQAMAPHSPTMAANPTMAVSRRTVANHPTVEGNSHSTLASVLAMLLA